MAWVDLLSQFPHLQIQSIQQEYQQITVVLVSTRENDRCPTCQTQTLNTHGWFTRHIHSLPCSGQAVVFLIQARRFRCPNTACPRKTFREDLSALADRYQRRTQAVSQLLCSGAAIAGGQADARLAAQMQLPANRSTLLRSLIRQGMFPKIAPRGVGVDDFAWTKRRRYGTILVDLEKHQLLALLADGEAETVATWFCQHPSVQIVTRDRSSSFADAIRRGAPQALQIADRFHLHMNAMACLETLLTREQATLCRGAATLRTEHRQAHPVPPPKPLVPEQQRSQRRARRYARYEQIVQRKAQGWSQRAIAQEIGLHSQTEEGTKEPEWREWNVPTLREWCIQANANVIKLEEATESTFDYWIKVSTLDKGNPLLIPVKLADYHKEHLTDPETGKRRKINSSVALNRREDAWYALLDHTLDLLAQTHGKMQILDLAVHLGYTKRYLDRLFQEHVGVSPKLLASILRFQEVYQGWMQHRSPSSFRSQWPASYYDQSHFIKEFKRFTGFTPQQYTAITNKFGRAFSASP